MRSDAARFLLAFALGLVFALGLGLAGLSKPSTVLGFLDVTGEWQPALAFAMAAALAVLAPLGALIRRRATPVCAADFAVPPPGKVDRRLLGGALLFGIGWGIGGFCPGPALVGLGGLAPGALLFTAAMALGMLGYDLLLRR